MNIPLSRQVQFYLQLNVNKYQQEENINKSERVLLFWFLNQNVVSIGIQ